MSDEIIKGVLPRDQNSNPISVLALGAVDSITVGAASANVALPAEGGEGEIVRVACDTDCYIRFGLTGDSASSADHLFLQGVEYFQVPDNAGFLAAIQVSAAGVLTVSAAV